MTARRSRLLALGLLAVLVAGLLTAIATPMAGGMIRDGRARAQAYARLARASVHAKEHDGVADALKQLESQPFWSRVYADATPNGATSKLQADVRVALGPRSAGATLTALDPRSVGEATEIGCRVHLVGDSKVLAELLSGFETAPKWYRIRRLSVSGPATQGVERNEPLDIDLDIIGYDVPVLAPEIS